MKTEHVYSKHHTRQMRVNELTVRESHTGTVIATIMREDGKSLQLLMTESEAKSFAAKLAAPDGPAPKIDRAARFVCHDATVETVNGVARLEYLGDGRYRVADGAAIVARCRSIHNGAQWTVEGSRAKYPTRQAAVTHVMENL